MTHCTIMRNWLLLNKLEGNDLLFVSLFPTIIIVFLFFHFMSLNQAHPKNMTTQHNILSSKNVKNILLSKLFFFF